MGSIIADPEDTFQVEMLGIFFPLKGPIRVRFNRWHYSQILYTPYYLNLAVHKLFQVYGVLFAIFDECIHFGEIGRSLTSSCVFRSRSADSADQTQRPISRGNRHSTFYLPWLGMANAADADGRPYQSLSSACNHLIDGRPVAP